MYLVQWVPTTKSRCWAVVFNQKLHCCLSCRGFFPFWGEQTWLGTLLATASLVVVGSEPCVAPFGTLVSSDLHHRVDPPQLDSSLSVPQVPSSHHALL